MTRTISALTLALFACGAALAEPPRPETTTYVDGNLTGVSPNTGGTLMFSDEKAMYLRTTSANVTVPYASISKAELGAPREHSHVPLYKFWVRHKRNENTQTRYLTLAFKSSDGDAQSMTLELAQSAVPNVMSTLQSHTRPGIVPEGSVPKVKLTDDQILADAPAASSNAPWWGDDYWKTAANKDKWNKASSTSAGSTSAGSTSAASTSAASGQ